MKTLCEIKSGTFYYHQINASKLTTIIRICHYKRTSSPNQFNKVK